MTNDKALINDRMRQVAEAEWQAKWRKLEEEDIQLDEAGKAEAARLEKNVNAFMSAAAKPKSKPKMGGGCLCVGMEGVVGMSKKNTGGGR